VFLTHSLTVCERGDFYRILDMDPEAFDAEVMRQTNRTARRAFPWVFDLENGQFIALRDRLVACFQEMGAARREGAAPLRQLGLKLRFGALLWRQFFQPMVRVETA
jgi:magnesium-protoporphyrin IX monomethyl ester (oxidative) cyclase